MAAKKCAVVERAGNKVINIVMADPASDLAHAGSDIWEIKPGEMAGIGWARKPTPFEGFDPPLGWSVSDDEG